MATLGRKDAYPLENYKRGTRVWLRDNEHVWLRAALEEDLKFTTQTFKLKREIDDEIVEEKFDPDALPFLANPEILIGKDDLTNMSYLHEPAVLHNLRFRFEKKKAIYTYCGIVLVAINPYADCSQLYSDDVISIYGNSGNQARGNLDPHIFAISAEAYYDMREYEKNQSIIVSGESGAGKTVSAKFVMKYLANVAGSKKPRRSSDGSPGIESRVLASNPIMESIGNAKTIRNDNSSRFGKFIQINFAEDYSIAGAEMKTYLLEKSRVVFQSKNERNYHVFYQMCAASTHPLLSKLDLMSSEDYLYTNQGQDPFIPGVDDQKDFSELTKAFDMLKINQKRQAEIFQIFAGVLLLGNLQFEPTGNGEQSTISRSSSSIIDKLCDQSIFNVESNPLKTWLSAREIRAGSEVVRKHLNVNDASANRDALAKMIYACMFNWIVDKINESLDHQHNASKSSRRVKASKFIGVLDIYGFETFDINSFEQFCINYANEKLQQQFNQHVFKLEQQEYEREEISWVRIDFYDNQPCIDLIEAQPNGIISYLDEQCKMGRGSDEDWLNLMKNCPKLKKSSHLVMPKFKDPSFLVKHFAADVSYRIDGFLEKNKDTVNEQLLGVFAKTQFAFLKEVIHHVLDTSSTGAKRKKTVAIQFKESLSELINVLSVTRPHYVRCIKPNDEKEYFYFEPKRAIQQLRACGVLETVRISAAGYPSRWAYDEFGRRYRVLYPEGKALWKHKPKEFAKLACEKWLEPEKFALGKTKMFFRVGQVARLEKNRQDVLSESAIKIQKIWRGFVARRRYLKMQASIRTIQAATRAFLAYRRLKYLQMHRATICIQAAWRGYQQKQKYNKIRNAIISIQAAFRAREVRRRILAIRFEKSAVTIQRYFRGFLVRREHIKRIRKIVKVQCCIRRFLAKRQLKKLKAERTTVLFWENKHQSLEKKIIDMQQKLDAMASERNQYAVRCATLDEVKAQCDRLLIEREQLLAIKDVKEMQDIQMKDLNDKLIAQASEIENITKKFNEELSAIQDIKEMQDLQLVQLNDQLTSQATEMDEITQKFTDLTILNESYKSQIESLTSNQLKELETLRENYTKMEESYRKIDSQLYVEKEKVKRIESERNEMRQQLASNADLLVSEFTRGSDLRNSMRSISSDGTTVDSATDSQTVIKQYEHIRDLNAKLQSMQREKDRLLNQCMHLQNETNANHFSTKETYDSLKTQDLEMENAKLKRDIADLCMNRGKSGMDDYITQLQETLENRQQENIELRALLANVYERRSGHSPKPEADDYGYHSTENSDDGTNSTTDTYIDDILEKERLLRNTLKENQILATESAAKDEIITELEEQLRNLSNIHHDGASETSSMNTSMIQTKVLCENMLLQQKVNRQSDELYELRSQLRGYSTSSDSAASDQHQGDGDFVRLQPLHSNNTHSGYLHVFNVPEFARVLIYELKPRIAKQLTHCLPAYLLLAGFRYYDREKDETAITGLFAAAQSVLKEIAVNSNDADILSLWLINTWRLFNLLRQYSSEENEEWSVQNTEKQNSHKITNFNVEPLRNQLKIRIEVFYQSFMKKTVEPLLSPKIVPGVLQHDSSQLLASSNGPSHSGLTRQLSKDVVVQRALDDLIALLNVVYNKLQAFGADTILIKQTFWQITKWICAQALNNLMFRKDLCKFEKAIQIKHNVSELQNWLYQKGLGDIRPVLEPLVQACHLLQSRKDEGNLETLCGEMTSELNAKQVVSILQHYTPSDGFEEDAIDMEFLIKVQTRLAARAAASGDDNEDKEKLILPGTFLQPFNCELFVYSDVNLETLTLPPSLHLNNVARFA